MARKPFKKIFLINPPTGLYRRDDRCQCTVEDQTVQVVFPPMDLALSAACAERTGSKCRIYDYPAANKTWEHFISHLKKFKPDVLILNSTTATLDGDLETCRIAKELNPDIVTVAKGETLVVNARSVLVDYPHLDVILPNEPELAVEEIASGVSFSDIRGLHFRGELLQRFEEKPGEHLVEPEGKAQIARSKKRSAGPEKNIELQEQEDFAERVFFTGKRDLNYDLDELPLPARHLLKNQLYTSPETGNPIAVIHGNRGCPAKCVFCPAGVLTDFTVRFRSTDSVVAELKECVDNYGIREFLFHGDTFPINKKWLLELCEKIQAANLDIHWGCNSRVDSMDDERAEAMKAAGCWVVAFGIETGDQEMLEHIKKNATLEQARKSVDCVKRAGLKVHTFFVIGLPWETEETLEHTYSFVQELDPDFFDFNIATPLPGTELHEIAIRDDLLVEGYDPARAGYASGAMKTYSGLTSAFFEEWRKKHLLKMYLRPRYIARMLTGAGGAKNTLHYASAGAKRLKQLILN